MAEKMADNKKNKHNKQNNIGGKLKKPNTKSAVKQYNIILLLLLVLAFIVLAFVYSRIIYNSVTNERLKDVDRAADTILAMHESQENKDTAFESKEFSAYLDAVAQTSDSYVWVYKNSGKIVYANEIPAEASNNLRVLQDGNIYLPSEISQLEVPPEGLSFTGGNLLGLFQSNEKTSNWITVIKPIYGDDTDISAKLMISTRVEPVQEGTTYILEGLLIVCIVVITLTILIINIYTKRISDPIENLSEAANKVANGDYTARVDINSLQESGTVSSEDTDIMVLVRTFNRMVAQIERGNSEQTDFIASISHDLRTPLTSIKGFVTAILDGTIPPEKQEHYLQIVQNETNRLSDLVSEMNEVMQLENTEVNSGDFAEFNFNDVIMRTIEGTEILITEKNITIQTNIGPNTKPSIVYGDEQQIERVLYNLVTNAIKFVPENDGVIYISVKPQGRDILIVSVEDNGPGIDEDKLSHIFDRFYKADHSRTGNTGSGLGLYICKKILQRHGQSIFASRSELMGGAKFEFTLPLVH